MIAARRRPMRSTTLPASSADSEQRQRGGRGDHAGGRRAAGSLERQPRQGHHHDAVARARHERGRLEQHEGSAPPAVGRHAPTVPEQRRGTRSLGGAAGADRAAPGRGADRPARAAHRTRSSSHPREVTSTDVSPATGAGDASRVWWPRSLLRPPASAMLGRRAGGSSRGSPAVPSKLLRSGAAVAVLLATVFVFVDPAFAAGGTLKDPGVAVRGDQRRTSSSTGPTATPASRACSRSQGGSKPDACSHGDEPDDGVIGTAAGRRAERRVLHRPGRPQRRDQQRQHDARRGERRRPSRAASRSWAPRALPNAVLQLLRHPGRDQRRAEDAHLQPRLRTTRPATPMPATRRSSTSTSRTATATRSLFVDEDGDPVNGGDIVLDLRIEQANDGPNLEIEALEPAHRGPGRRRGHPHQHRRHPRLRTTTCSSPTPTSTTTRSTT